MATTNSDTSVVTSAIVSECDTEMEDPGTIQGNAARLPGESESLPADPKTVLKAPDSIREILSKDRILINDKRTCSELLDTARNAVLDIVLKDMATESLQGNIDERKSIAIEIGQALEGAAKVKRGVPKPHCKDAYRLILASESGERT